MTSTTGAPMIQRKKRHPIRGLISGLIFGLGLGLMAIVYNFYALGDFTPWILVIVGVVLGFALSFVPRPWGRKPAPTSTSL